jgi:general secretion pathway protein L
VSVLEASQPWSLFGFDVRRGLHYFRAGWREFLWGDDSVVLSAVDEVVAARQLSGEVCYFKAGKIVATPGNLDDVAARAVVLPDELALCKTLTVPAAAEADLASMLALEVTTSSPFPKGDTCYGWSIAERRTHDLLVHLVISSKSAVMAFIAANGEREEAGTYEAWVQVADRMVMVSGFGEAPRLQRNHRRLRRMALIVAYCVAAIMLLVALAAGTKYLELRKVRATGLKVEQSAQDAVALRTALASSKSMIVEINGLLAAYPSPRRELQRLSALLDDDTWLGLVEIQGSTVKIEGESGDAAAVMQKLLGQSAYAQVEAPSAFRKVGSGLEHFVLKITLAGAGKNP